MSASKHLLRALARWPTDVLRPEHSFQTAMRTRLTPNPPSSPPPTAAEKAAGLSQQQINALYSLVENRYSERYPVPEAFLRPAFNPEYYARLLAEIEAAPTRSWFGRMVNRWRGSLRFS